MATTGLFVEILVIGAMMELWIAIALLALLYPQQSVALSGILEGAKEFGTLLLVPMFALTYALGWIVNFVAERLFKLRFQESIRDRFFSGTGINYETARIRVLQNGSAELVRDVLFDRHIIRIARANVVNFGMLAVAFLFHLHHASTIAILACSAASIVLATLSFFQWFTRYKSHYKRIRDCAKELA